MVQTLHFQNLESLLADFFPFVLCKFRYCDDFQAMVHCLFLCPNVLQIDDDNSSSLCQALVLSLLVHAL